MLTQAVEQRLKRPVRCKNDIIYSIFLLSLCQTGCFEEEDAGVTVGSRMNDKDQPFPLHHMFVYVARQRASTLPAD